MKEEELFEGMYIEGYIHKFSCVKYDEDKHIRYAIGSFMTRQLLDNCLTLMQKGTVMKLSNKNYRTFKKCYKCKALRVHDENNGDGVHAIIYYDDINTINVYENENKVDKVFDYLKANTECGLLDEWKSYFFNELWSGGYISECDGFDYTEKAPTVLVIKNIDTDLIRSFKAVGLKSGEITMPVNEVEEIDTSMTFLDIIEKLIIPNIEADKCHYNIGEPISEVLTVPIIDENTGDIKRLYPRQQVIAQGAINSVKNGLKVPILNCGMGTGKTLMSTRIAYALIKEHFKKENARIGLIMPSHLLNKWIREFKNSYYPLGIRPTFYVIERFTDVDKLPRKPKGIEIVIFQKDITKRTYLHEYMGIDKHKPRREVYDFLESLYNKYSEKDRVVIENFKNLSITEMKYVAIKAEKLYKKKVILYKEQLDNHGDIDGYKVVTTSKTLLDTFGVSNKSYDFYIKDLKLVLDVVSTLHTTILDEKICDKINGTNKPLICPICGDPIYLKSNDIFDLDKVNKYVCYKPDSMNSENLHCVNYIKADGSRLTDEEKRAVRKSKMNIIPTTKKVKFPYVDDDGNELKGEELKRAKENGSYNILVMKCNAKLWGAKDQKGFRDYDSAKYYKKRFGAGSIDILIPDEVHQYSRLSNQNSSFAQLCKCSKVIIPLTGTLTGGKASDLFYLLWNLCPEKMVQLVFKFKELGRFIDMFGRRKRVTKNYYDKFNKSGTGRTVTGSWTEIPGISPQMVNLVLSSMMISRTIDDMAIPMPRIRYFKHACDMDEELADGYNMLKNDIVSFIAEHQGMNVGGIYLNSLLSYPDMPQQEPLFALNGELYVATPTKIEIEGKLFNKERKLIETIEKELSEDRRVLVYSVFSGSKGVSRRLIQILKTKFRVAELTSSIKLQKREEWIEQQYKKGIQVIVTNPKCVETGLDIIQYPTIYYYETSYDIKVMRQSERRAYRPNQKSECRIYYSYYKNTLQEDALKLQGNKKSSSLAIEGVFSEDLLSQFGDIGESAASILNKILEGKIRMKESDLDAFGFEEEEVSYEFNDINNETDIEIRRKIITTENVVLPKSQVNQLSIFEIDEEFLKQRNSKKAKAKVSLGHLGFIFE